MKFTDGMWHVREGIELNWMSHLERSSTTSSTLELLLTKYTRGRGDKLNTPTLSATVRSPLSGVAAVKFQHWAGAGQDPANFQLQEDTQILKLNKRSSDELSFSTGPLDVNIDAKANSLGFQYSSHGRKLTGHGWRSIAYVTDQDTPGFQYDHELYAERKHHVLVEFDLAVGEKIYGLGERFGNFVKNGQTVDIWNQDGGTSSEQAYKNVPFYISSRGYGVFINHPGHVSLEIQSERTTRINIAVEGESLEYMVISGPSPRDILHRYTALTGRPSLPPAWSYGLWLTTSFTTSYDEQTVTSFLDGLAERSIPLSVFHFDAYW